MYIVQYTTASDDLNATGSITCPNGRYLFLNYISTCGGKSKYLPITGSGEGVVIIFMVDIIIVIHLELNQYIDPEYATLP